MYVTEAAPALYALVINPPDALGPSALEFCRDRGVVGVGWGVGDAPLDWMGYTARATARDGRVHPAVVQIHDLPEGSLIWARERGTSRYAIGEVTGPWRYLASPTAAQVDVQNVRPVRMATCASTSQVPPSIVNRFIGDWAIQRIYDEHAAWQSASLLAQLSAGSDVRPLTLDDALTAHMSDDEIRTIVCRYLQHAYGHPLGEPVLRPVSGAWEYVVRDENGGRAIIRARRGSSIVSRRAGSPPLGAVERIFVFSPTGTYGPEATANVTEIPYAAIVDFIRGEPSVLPAPYSGCLDGAGRG